MADCMLIAGTVSHYNASYRLWNSTTKHAFRHPGTTASVMYWDGHVAAVRHKTVTGESVYHELFLTNP